MKQTAQNGAAFDLGVVRKMCLNSPIRPLVSPRTGELSFEANAGTIRDPATGKYVKQRKTFKASKFDSVEDAFRSASSWIKDMRTITNADKSAVLAVPPIIRNQLLAIAEIAQGKNRDMLYVYQRGLAAIEAEEVKKAITFAEAGAVLVAHKKKEGRSAAYGRELHILFQAFGNGGFANKKLHEITADEVEEWLEDCDISSVTWNNYRRMLAVLWNFGRSERNGWVRQNIISDVIQKDEKHDEVTALSVRQATALLATAQAEIPRLIPYLVVGMFCGLRRSEAQVARWEDIDWETNSIRAKGGKMRSATSRFVELDPVAIDWLKPLAQEEGELCSTKYSRRTDLKRLRELTFDFDGNIFRHSFGSYYSALHQNWSATAVQMGHESVKMLMKRYRKPVAREVAVKFWALTRATVLKKDPEEPINS